MLHNTSRQFSFLRQAIFAIISTVLALALAISPVFVFQTPTFAQTTNQTYGCGTYGSGDYDTNDCVLGTTPAPTITTSPTPSPTTSTGGLPVTGQQLIFGGITGLALIVIGATMLFRRRRSSFDANQKM
jgi:LPXTG-motif cell wall-anchored protein